MKTRQKSRRRCFDGRPAIVESLEPRTLLAAVVQAVQIDNQAPEVLGEFGDVKLLTLQDSDSTRVFGTDGTQAGTVELVDVTGKFNKNDILGTLGSDVVFRNRGNNTLWLTDGTTAGTIQLAVVSATGTGLEFNSEFYFSGNGGNGAELWKTDGTAVGTVEVKDINTGQAGPAGRVLYWDAVPDAVSYDVRVDDFTRCQTFAGNVECTQVTVHSVEDVAGTSLETTAQGALWYVRPKFSDGSVGDYLEDTYTIPATSGSSGFPSEFTIFNGELYFAAETREFGREIWKTDGTSDGTVLAVDVVPGPSSSAPQEFVEFDGDLFFGSLGSNNLYRTDGTQSGTHRVFGGQGSTRSNVAGSFPIAVVNNRLIAQQMGNGNSATQRRLVSLDSATDTVPTDLGVTGSEAKSNSGGHFGSETWFDGFLVVNDRLLFRRVNRNSVSSSAVSNSGRLWTTDGVTAEFSANPIGALWNEVHGPRLGVLDSLLQVGEIHENDFYFTVFNREFRDGTDAFTAAYKTNGAPNGLTLLSMHFNEALSGTGTFVTRFNRYAVVNGTTYYLQAHSQDLSVASLWDLYRVNPSGDDFLLAEDLGEGDIFQFNDELFLSLPVNGGSALYRVTEQQFHDPVFVNAGVGTQATGTPAFGWNDAGANVRRYELYINPVGARATASYRQTNLTTTTHTPATALADGDYEVWLRVHFEDGSRSRWGGAGVALTVDTGQVPPNTPPEITSPAQVDSSLRPQIKWTTISGAIRYELWVSTANDITPVIHETNLTSTAFVPTNDMSPGKYRIWVRAHRANSQTRWTPTYRTEILHDVVQITGGTGSQETLAPTITWTASPGAARYDLYINETGVGQAAYRRTTLTGTSHTLETELESGKDYQVWLRAHFNDGSRSRWGAATALTVINGAFRTIVPQLSLNGIVGSWPAIDGAVEYFTWVNRFHENGRFFTERGLNQSTTGTSLNFDFGPGRFRVWIIAVDAAGTQSAWSNHVTFTIA